MLAFLSLGSAPNPMLQEGDLNSPLLQQHPSSPFLADALLSSATSCTSTPMTPEEPELFDLGVDIQAELEKDAPELSDFMLLDPQGKMTLCCTHTSFFSLSLQLSSLSSHCLLLCAASFVCCKPKKHKIKWP